MFKKCLKIVLKNNVLRIFLKMFQFILENTQKYSKIFKINLVYAIVA